MAEIVWKFCQNDELFQARQYFSARNFIAPRFQTHIRQNCLLTPNFQTSKSLYLHSKMVVHKAANDADFTEKLNQSGSKLVVIDFSATW